MNILKTMSQVLTLLVVATDSALIISGSTGCIKSAEFTATKVGREGESYMHNSGVTGRGGESVEEKLKSLNGFITGHFDPPKSYAASVGLFGSSGRTSYEECSGDPAKNCIIKSPCSDNQSSTKNLRGGKGLPEGYRASGLRL